MPYSTFMMHPDQHGTCAVVQASLTGGLGLQPKCDFLKLGVSFIFLMFFIEIEVLADGLVTSLKYAELQINCINPIWVNKQKIFLGCVH